MMQTTLKKALAKIEALPSEDQEHIARQLLSRVEKLHKLRKEIDKGIRSLDAGEGRPLHVEKFLHEQVAK